MDQAVFHDDEWTLDDALDHARHVEDIGKMVAACKPPYILGIHGDWGTGKTSFLRKLHLYLAGKDSGYDEAEEMVPRLWPERQIDEEKLETIWFDSWRYQGEATPVVALLNEIRTHFTWSRRLVGKAAKLSFSALMSIDELTKKVGFQASKIAEGSEKWEQDRLAQALPSQLCRDLLEDAIENLLGRNRNKRLVIFVDDLDRCQSQVAFRFLEAIKVYLSLPNCVFVLGLDMRHVRQAVANELKKTGMIVEGETEHPHLHAAAYLSKLFQHVHYLPAVTNQRSYLQSLLKDDVFTDGQNRIDQEWIDIITEYSLLPPNPRKIKFFVNGLTFYLRQLRRRFQNLGSQPDRKLALIFAYLKLMANDVYRIVESDPNFWSSRLLHFCQTSKAGGEKEHPALRNLTLPEEGSALPSEAGYKYTPLFPDPAEESLFRAARLIREWGEGEGEAPTDDELRLYLLQD